MSEIIMPDQFTGMSALIDINKILDAKAQSQGLMFTTMDPSLRVKGALSTGLYSFDLMSGGGYAGGRFVYVYGPTGSCKSTLTFHGIKSAIDHKIMSVINDHESSVDPTYFKNIGVDLDEACGRLNKKGEWAVKPTLRYALGTTAEATFKFMNQVMHQLPDKIQLLDSKEDAYRYFLIHPEYDYRLTWKSINEGLKNKKVVEVGDFSPQMVFLTDSLKSMLPEAKDNDIDSDPIAMLARTLSTCFPLVKSLLGAKHCIYLATNHITINPMARFQSPETEPGGAAVQFYPDMKIKMNMSQAQSNVISEPHVSGNGEDRYTEGRATIIKNKAGPSFRKMPFRLWRDELGQPGRGIDPVFDIYTFLRKCDLIEKLDKDNFGIKLKGWEAKNFSWLDFKKMVLLDKDGKQIRQEIEAMLADGSAFDLYYERLSKGGDDDDDKKVAEKSKKGRKKASEASETSEVEEVEVSEDPVEV